MTTIVTLARLASLSLSCILSGTDSDQEAVRNVLVAHSDHWFHWLIWSTVAVAVGVVCEIPECVYEWRVWIKNRKEIPFEDKPKRLSIPLSVLGAIIVAAGVAVEGIAEYNGANAETAVRNFDETITLKAQIDAGSAKKSADGAVAALKEANRQLGEISHKSLKAGEEAEYARRDIASARKDLAADRQELIDIRSPRKLIGLALLKVQLAPLKGMGYQIEVFRNEESANLAKSIDKALSEDGMVWKPANPLLTGSIQLIGEGRTFSANECAETGIQVHVSQKDAEDDNPLNQLGTVRRQFSPNIVASARTLERILGPHISPPNPLNVSEVPELYPWMQPGTMAICIGEKPLDHP
jgi:hypothetical protein